MGIPSFRHLLLPTWNIGVSEPPIEASLTLDSPHFSPLTPREGRWLQVVCSLEASSLDFLTHSSLPSLMLKGRGIPESHQEHRVVRWKESESLMGHDRQRISAGLHWKPLNPGLICSCIWPPLHTEGRFSYPYVGIRYTQEAVQTLSQIQATKQARLLPK